MLATPARPAFVPQRQPLARRLRRVLRVTERAWGLPPLHTAPARSAP